MEDFQQLKISSGEYWDLFLHADQGLLGRCYFWYKGEEKDLMDIPEMATLELRANGARLKKTLEELFQPHCFNYQSLNMRTPHLHFHVLPRYGTERKFEGITFTDENFGYIYRGGGGALLDPSILVKIRDAVAEKYLGLGRLPPI